MTTEGLHKRYLVVTLVIGKEAAELFSLSKNSIKSYAEKIGADFKYINQNLFSDAKISIPYNKLQIRNFLDSYDRVLFLDCDIIVSPETPNIFALVPEDAIGVINDTELYDRSQNIQKVQKELGKVEGWETDYFNSGVMVVSKVHQDLFNEPDEFFSDEFYEQTYLNWKARHLNYRIHYLDHKFNWIFSPKFKHLSPTSGYIVHFAGWGFQLPKNQDDDKHPYKYHQMKCFLDYLEGRTTLRIHPQQLTVTSGKIQKDAGLWKLVSSAGNIGLVSSSPHMKIPGGLYKITIDFGLFLTEDLDSQLKRQQDIAFVFDIVSNQSKYLWNKYKVNIYQNKFECFIDLVDVKDLEFRFYASDIAFSINLIELVLIKAKEDALEKLSITQPSFEAQREFNYSADNLTVATQIISEFSCKQNHPRVLLEGFPLTLRQGTGIYTYSISLLQALNNLDVLDIGLLLLFDTPVKRLRHPHKNLFRQLSFYAQLLSYLSQNRTKIPKYQKLRQDDSDAQPNYQAISKYLAVSGDCISILVSFLRKLNLISLPSYMKSSLLEVLLEGESINYDFLSKNIPYIIDFHRHHLLLRNMFNIKNFIDIKEINVPYDVFHCTHLSPLAVTGIPRVTTIHDIIPLLRPELSKDHRLLFAKLLEFNIRQSSHIIAVSEATKRDIVSCCNVSPDKVTVIYEAASSNLSPVSCREATAILRSLELLDSSGSPEPYFLFIGNIEPKKNVKRILEAFQEFLLIDPVGYKLVIVGAPAWGYNSVKDILQEMVEAQTVIFTGYLPTHYLPALLSHARAFLFPSLTEGFGLPILEAMACGCPVITSNIPSVTEVCGDAAIQVNPQSVSEICQAMIQVASNDELCKKLREKGFQRNQLFSWDKCAKKTLDVYEEARRNYGVSCA